MPMLDAYIPADALSPEAESELVSSLTDILLRNEGADPSNETVRSIAWVFLHRPERVFVAGAPADAPRYRLVASVPEGQFDDERRAALVAEMTNAVLDAEHGAHDRDPARVWVIASEISDGTWGAVGRVQRLADIAAFALGDRDKGRAYAERRLAHVRGATAELVS